MTATPSHEHLLEERTDGVVPRVEVGNWVKVEMRSEKFWCLVRSVRADGALMASVENDLIYSMHRVGDRIVIQPSNVLETANDADYLMFQSLILTLGDREGALMWRDLRRS